MQTKLITLSPELIAAIDSARDGAAFSNWIESQLWRLKTVRDAAEQGGITNPARPLESRGRRKKD